VWSKRSPDPSGETSEALVGGRLMLHGRKSRMPPTDGRLAESSYLDRREIGCETCSRIPGSGNFGSIIANRSRVTPLHSWSVSVAEVLSDKTRRERRFRTGARRHPINVSDGGVSSLIVRIHVLGPPPGKAETVTVVSDILRDQLPMARTGYTRPLPVVKRSFSVSDRSPVGASDSPTW
jgi:hypothetical protein